jgi:hypothetical protein
VQYQQGTLLHAIHLMVIDEQPEPLSMKDIIPETVPSTAPSKP